MKYLYVINVTIMEFHVDKKINPYPKGSMGYERIELNYKLEELKRVITVEFFSMFPLKYLPFSKKVRDYYRVKNNT